MANGSKWPGVLKPAGSSRRMFRNRLAPAARILITVPEMIWSTLYLIDRTAWRAAIRPPVRLAASTPTHRLWK